MRSSFIAALLLLFPLLAFGQGKYETTFLKPLATGGVTSVSGLASVCTPLTTTGASVSGNIATLTFSGNPQASGFVNGRNVLVVNFSGADTYFNGTFTLTGVTTSTISYALSHGNAVATSNGGAVQFQTASAACAPTVTVYSDAALTLTLAQPFGDDGRGNVSFFATPGQYYLGYFASGINPIPLTNVTVAVTPNNAGSVVLGASTVSSLTDSGAMSVAGQITSTLANGTAPLVITSSTVVANLNAALHNGKAAPGGNIVGDTDNQTLTGKTYDAEATGNTLTAPSKVWIPAAGCQNTTPASFWDLPTATPAAAACVTGTNTQKGVLDYADTAGGFSAQTTELLPADFTGNIDARIIWFTTATTGNVKWSLSTVCTDVGATATDDPAFNAASTVTTAAPGTANRLQTSSISAVTITGCSAGQILHVKLFRDGNDAADTITATARFYGLELTIRRAM